MKLLDTVKLPRDFAKRRPRQLSGGQKQRVGIARAFAGNPTMVIADEPVSALDVSVQAAVTELLMDIQRDHRTTLLFISHDLSVVRYLADRIVVMYLGQIMEQGTTDEVFSPPYHPYTEALLSAVPIADTQVKKRKVLLTGEIPSPSNPPPGCPFSTRCPYMIAGTCDVIPPPVVEPSPGHRILCHLPLDTLMAMQPVIRGGDTRSRTAPRDWTSTELPHVLSRCLLRPAHRFRARARWRRLGAEVTALAGRGRVRPARRRFRAEAVRHRRSRGAALERRRPPRRGLRRDRRRAEGGAGRGGAAAWQDRRGAKAVVCLGGGSALDAGKLAAVMLGADAPVSDFRLRGEAAAGKVGADRLRADHRGHRLGDDRHLGRLRREQDEILVLGRAARSRPRAARSGADASACRRNSPR